MRAFFNRHPDRTSESHRRSEAATPWPHLRDLLEADPDAVFVMLGGIDAGRPRSARSLLEECQDLITVVDGVPGNRLDTLTLPVVECDDLVSIAAGAQVLGVTLPVDTPLMTRTARSTQTQALKGG